MATPARIRDAGDSLKKGAIATMTITGIIENTMALMTTPPPVDPPPTERPRTIATATPNIAPEDTPVVYASASGFFITLCMTAPATAREEPAIMQNRARGTRYSQRILSENHSSFSCIRSYVLPER